MRISAAECNFVHSGVADPPVCSPEERSIDHAVLLVRCIVVARVYFSIAARASSRLVT
jgi:hypothetical protein